MGIERAIELNASAIAFLGTSLGRAHHRNWLVLPLVVTAFLFQHAVQGWCPPVPILRRLGFRSTDEIEQERRKLLALRTPARPCGYSSSTGWFPEAFGITEHGRPPELVFAIVARVFDPAESQSTNCASRKAAGRPNVGVRDQYQA